MCIGAAVGALVGGVIGAGSVALPQMVQNVRDGQPLTANIDPAEVGKAAAVGAVSGAVAGATFGLGTAVLGSGLAGTAASGALSGVMGGQASVLAESTWDEYIKWKHGQPAEIQNIVNNAMTNGILDIRQMAVDAVSGAISVGIGKAGISVLGKAGLVVFEQSEVVGPPMLKFYPNGEMYLEYGKRIYLPQDTIDKLLTAIATGNTVIVQEILTQLSFKTTEEVIDDD